MDSAQSNQTKVLVKMKILFLFIIMIAMAECVEEKRERDE